VAIVGTSYSAEPAFHFEGFLKQALSADVINLALEGKGPFKPMDEALQGTILEDTGVRVVVWEIPERYVPSRSLR
jgi:alginate O-acetyltransferase complex protein AlgJ